MCLNPRKEVAILVFANSSVEELSTKCIPKSGRFFDALTDRTLATVKKTQFPYFLITERQQSGSSFGERFTNAIQSVFDKGYERIITIGNDTPLLQTAHITETARQLAEGKTVLGPSVDGGFYLMGLHKSQFSASQFEKLSWQTASLLQEVSVLLSGESNQPIRLRTLFDIDDLHDLNLFIDRFRNIPEKLFKIIRSLLVKIIENFRFLFPFFENQLHKAFYNKGSPGVLHS